MTLNLRQRIAGALFGLTTLTAGFMAVLLWAGHFWLESRTLDGILDRQLNAYVATGAPPQAASGVRAYRSAHDAPPAELRDFAPGSYRDQAVGDGIFHVLIHEVAPGDRIWLLYDVREFQQRELWLRLALCASVVLIGLLAWSLSGRVSRRLLEPLHTLVQQLRTLDWNQRTHRLATAQTDDDMKVIVTALNRLLAEVDELMQRERAFASAASHELRTPLASIRAAADVLNTQPANSAEPLARIERAVSAASRDLDALLALSATRKLPPAESLQLDQVLPAMAQPYLLEAAPAVSIEWRIAPAWIEAPRPVLDIVFTNLLRNALRAAHRRVVVHADAGRITIDDDGDGISTDLRPHVFEPGVKGHAGGSGMGLYIARVLAERLGWTLELNPSAMCAGAQSSLRFRE